MQRYFAKTKEDNNLILYDTDWHHIKNVMRNQPDDIIEVVYNNIVYHAKIKNIENKLLEIVSESKEDKENKIDLTVAISLVNEQKMDLILQKLTELGVTKIIPIKTARSIVKIDNQKIEKKITRWQIICKEASEQSKRTTIPKVESIISLKEIAKETSDIKLICSLNDDTKPLNNYLSTKQKTILFVIGPEGGFTAEEEQYLIDHDFKRTSLGKRVMRVETAAIYVASIINYICEG